MPDSSQSTDAQWETFWHAVDVAAKALGGGFNGCSGGCRRRPCEVDYDHAAVIVSRVFKELGMETPMPGLL